MSLSFQSSLFYIIISAASAIALSIYMYRHTVPVVSSAQRWVLTALRSLAFTLALIAIFEPLFTFSSSQKELPAVAVLVDNSLSMSHKDRIGSRDSVVRSLLQSSAYALLESGVSTHAYAFSYNTSPLVRDSLLMNGGSTNISSAIQSAVKESPAALRSIILITDGNYNAGSNPLYDAERSHIPMFTIGVGDSTEQNDIAVSKLITNSIAYVDAAIPVDASIKSSGMRQLTVAVVLMEEEKKADEKIVTLPSSESNIVQTPVQFSYTPKSDGVKKLSVRIPAIENETSHKNNIHSALVKVLKSKMNIVLIAGTPNPDVATVMQSLNNDKNITAQLFLQLPTGELKAQGSTVSLAQSLQSAECIVLIDFPTQQSTSQVIQSIKTQVQTKSPSLLFVAGSSIDLQKVKELEHFLPFNVISNRMDEQVVVPYIMPRHKYHALVQVDASRFPSFAWEQLPPVYASFQSFAVKPEAQTLLGVKIQGVTLQNPLVVTRDAVNMKSMAMLGYGIYRWKLLAGASDETRNVFDAWFSSVVRWLATRDQDSRLKAEASKELFSQGEPIEFTAQAYNENFQPVENADLQVNVNTVAGDHVASLSLQSIGSGRYEGSIPSINEGEYRFTASSLINGDTVARASGRFSVGEQSIEFAETKMNKPLLQQIASKSGGAYADAVQFDSLVQTILARTDMRPQERIKTSEIELWNLPQYLSFIIVLFAAEWFLRKRWGML